MSSLLPCTQNSRLMPKPNSSTKPLAFGNSSALTIRKPNSNVIAPYTASHPNKHNIGTPTHHPTCNDRVPLFLLGIVSSHSPDWQSGEWEETCDFKISSSLEVANCDLKFPESSSKVTICDLKPLPSFSMVAICDLKKSTSSLESWNIKSQKKCRLYEKRPQKCDRDAK